MKNKEMVKAINKCLKEKVFTFVCNVDDYDEMEPIFEDFTYEELKSINEANFKDGYRKNDVADKMEFVNKLPLEFKF